MVDICEVCSFENARNLIFLKIVLFACDSFYVLIPLIFDILRRHRWLHCCPRYLSQFLLTLLK